MSTSAAVEPATVDAGLIAKTKLAELIAEPRDIPRAVGSERRAWLLALRDRRAECQRVNRELGDAKERERQRIRREDERSDRLMADLNTQRDSLCCFTSRARMR